MAGTADRRTRSACPHSAGDVESVDICEVELDAVECELHLTGLRAGVGRVLNEEGIAGGVECVLRGDAARERLAEAVRVGGGRNARGTAGQAIDPRVGIDAG